MPECLRITRASRNIRALMPAIVPMGALQTELPDTGCVDPMNDLREHLALIEATAERSVGVNEYEHLLVQLLAMLRSDVVPRESGVAELTRIAQAWPWGAVEALEFCLRSLRWEELRQVLEAQRANNPDFRYRHLAKQVLEVYSEEWPSGEIYRTYRPDGA